jgi:hypothetical protein
MMAVMTVSPAPALSSATRGMSDAARRMDSAAQAVASDSTDPSGDLVTDFVDATVLAPIAYTANAVVARTAAETQAALLDVRA